MKKKKSNICMQLFLTFLKIGAFTFGGGYAMIPLIREEIVNKNHWIEEKDILDITAIAESTPGPIAINSATFVGSKIAGFAGAFLATLGVVTPSFWIIYAISFILRQFENARAVTYAFTGVRAAVLALILNAMLSMYGQCPKNCFSYIVMAGALIFVAFLKVNVLYVILICAAAGLVLSLVSIRKEGNH